MLYIPNSPGDIGNKEELKKLTPEEVRIAFCLLLKDFIDNKRRLSNVIFLSKRIYFFCKKHKTKKMQKAYRVLQFFAYQISSGMEDVITKEIAIYECSKLLSILIQSQKKQFDV